MIFTETHDLMSDTAIASLPENSRRRKIDPTTCERDYSNEEREFMQAMEEYKRQSGRNFPTCSEILEVVRNLGYSKTN